MSGSKCNLELWTIVKLPWNQSLKLDVVEVEPPPNGSFIELPGPKRRPVRPYLEPFANQDGIAARVLKGDGEAMPMAIILGEKTKVMPLSEPPLALSLRKDGGIWVQNRETLIHYETTDTKIRSLKFSGITLVGGIDSAVWVVGLDDAWFVTADGSVRGPYAWDAGFGSVTRGNVLCGLTKREPRAIKCLDTNGKEQSISLDASLEPFEKLLALGNDKIITMDASILRYRRNTVEVMTQTIQGAGITSTGEAFISGRTNDGIRLCTSQGIEKIFSLPFQLSENNTLPVVAIEGERVLAYGMDRAAWYDRERIENTFTVDEKEYREKVFPHQWILGTTRFATATSNGTVILSTTGPDGVALIGLRWKLE